MSEFTKGKWNFLEWPVSPDKEEKQKYLIGSPERAVGFIFHKANARLIANAPEMYKLMKSVVDFDYGAFKFDTEGNLVFTREKYDEFRDLLTRIDGKESDKN